MEYKRIQTMNVLKSRRKAFLLLAMLLTGGMASAQVTIKGNVFGGGYEGTVSENTTVTINGGTVGRKLTLDERKADPTGQVTRIRFGNVYGGGDGAIVHDSTELANGVKVPNYLQNSGEVYGNTNVTVRGDAVVRHAVYGGGNIATVGTCTVSEETGIANYTSGGKCSVTVLMR